MWKCERETEKLEMLQEIILSGYEPEEELNEDSSYEEVEEAYNAMLKEFEAVEDAMYPNGRDYDAEDFDD